MIILSQARSRLSAIALAGVVALTLAAPAQAAGSSMPSFKSKRQSAPSNCAGRGGISLC